MNILTILCIANAIRGGQWRHWFNIPADWKYEFPNNSDIFNAAIFSGVVFYLTYDWALSALGFVSMWIGASFGWGAYIGALYGLKPELKEQAFIDVFIGWAKKWPRVWGFLGLSLRGAVWGLCLAAAFYYRGYPEIAIDFIVSGAFMGVAYFLSWWWVKTRIGDNAGLAWGLSELIFPLFLFSPLLKL